MVPIVPSVRDRRPPPDTSQAENSAGMEQWGAASVGRGLDYKRFMHAIGGLAHRLHSYPTAWWRNTEAHCGARFATVSIGSARAVVRLFAFREKLGCISHAAGFRFECGSGEHGCPVILVARSRCMAVLNRAIACLRPSFHGRKGLLGIAAQAGPFSFPRPALLFYSTTGRAR